MKKRWIFSQIGFWLIMIVSFCYSNRDDLTWRMIPFFLIMIPILSYWGYKMQMQLTKKIVDNLNDSISLNDKEKVLLTSPCTYQNNWIGLGGQLFLTNQRICFIPHKLNWGKKSFFLTRNLIKEVNIIKSKVLKTDQMFIQLFDNKSFVFWVEDPSLWIEMLKSKC